MNDRHRFSSKSTSNSKTQRVNIKIRRIYWKHRINNNKGAKDILNELLKFSYNILVYFEIITISFHSRLHIWNKLSTSMWNEHRQLPAVFYNWSDHKCYQQIKGDEILLFAAACECNQAFNTGARFTTITRYCVQIW